MKFLRGLPERARVLALVLILAILCAASTGPAPIAVAALAFCAVAAVAFAWMVSTLIRDLQRSRERLAFALEAGEIGFYDWDLRTDRVICSAQYRRLLGLDPAAAMPSMTECLSGVHPEDLPRVQSALAATMDSGAPYDLEYRISLPDGGFRWVHSKGMGFARPGAKPQRVIGVLQDITARKAAEAALRNAHADLERRVDQQAAELGEASRALAAEEARYHMLFTRMLDGFALHEMVCDEAGRPQDYRFLEVNPAFERLTGIRACDAVGRRATEVIPGLEQSWIERYGHVAASGEPIRFESYSQPLGRHFEVVAFSPGQGLVATIFADISRRKEAEEELRRTQQAIAEQERLRVLGQMASGIAHDINNSLTPITTYAELLLEATPDLGERGQRFARSILTAAGDIRRTVGRLRELYRRRDSRDEVAPVDVPRFLREVVELNRPRWQDLPQKKGVTVAIQYALDPRAVSLPAVESELREALTNLIGNAVDAMPTGGTITLRSRYLAGEGVAIEVADTGTGMDEETLRQCMVPFYTTKGDAGTGLGLSMVYGIMQRHEGRVEIESTPGKGTTVRLCFPFRGRTTRPGGCDAAESPAMTGLRVLCVDDDPKVREAIVDLLLADGHMAETAGSGEAGLVAFDEAQERGRPFDVVFTDLGMPHVDGRMVALGVKTRSPRTPVVLLTGWGDFMEGDSRPEGVDAVLCKPPDLAGVRRALAEVRSDAGSADSGREEAG